MTMNNLDKLRRSKAAEAAHALLDDIRPVVELPNYRVDVDDAHPKLNERLDQSHALIDELCNGTVPKQYIFSADDPFCMTDVRESLIKTHMKSVLNQFGMWAIVDKTWTKELADFIGNRQTLEVMAGAGWLAKALREHGTQVIATDDASWRECHAFVQGDGTVTEVEALDAVDAIKAYPHAEVLVVSWPAYKDRTIVDVCDEWGCDRPIIYIGESQGGCTACSEFFDYFEAQPLDIRMPKHTGMHDGVYAGHWQRRKTAQGTVEA